MSRAALLLACAAFAAAVIDGHILFVGMGLGAFATILGRMAYRRAELSGWQRLQGAGAMALGGLAALVATGRFALSWWAVGRLSQLLS